MKLRKDAFAVCEESTKSKNQVLTTSGFPFLIIKVYSVFEGTSIKINHDCEAENYNKMMLYKNKSVVAGSNDWRWGIFREKP